MDFCSFWALPRHVDDAAFDVKANFLKHRIQEKAICNFLLSKMHYNRGAKKLLELPRISNNVEILLKVVEMKPPFEYEFT